MLRIESCLRLEQNGPQVRPRADLSHRHSHQYANLTVGEPRDRDKSRTAPTIAYSLRVRTDEARRSRMVTHGKIARVHQVSAICADVWPPVGAPKRGGQLRRRPRALVVVAVIADVFEGDVVFRYLP